MTAARKRVLFLVPSLIAGGAQRVFSVLLRHLDRDRFEPHLAVVQATGPYMADLPADVVVHNLNISRVRYSLPSVIKVIRKVRPDTVLCTLGHMNLTSVLAKPFLPKGTRLILREAAIATAFLEEEMRRPRLWRWLYRRFYRKADVIICLSDSMVDDFVNQFAPSWWLPAACAGRRGLMCCWTPCPRSWRACPRLALLSWGMARSNFP
jgi:hypothetical protein